jgi:hypothetical protein
MHFQKGAGRNGTKETSHLHHKDANRQAQRVDCEVLARVHTLRVLHLHKPARSAAVSTKPAKCECREEVTNLRMPAHVRDERVEGRGRPRDVHGHIEEVGPVAQHVEVLGRLVRLLPAKV